MGPGHAHVRDADGITALVHEGQTKAVRAIARSAPCHPQERIGAIGVYHRGIADAESFHASRHARCIAGACVCPYYDGFETVFLHCTRVTYNSDIMVIVPTCERSKALCVGLWVFSKWVK